MLKKTKQTKHRPIRKRNPVVVALLTQPKRNAGRHGNPNNVRSNKEISMKDIWDILLGIALVVFMVNLIWGVM